MAIIRGISDRADGTKSSAADKNWQPRAAANAATFAVRLVEELIRQRKQETVNSRDNDRYPSTVINTAYGQVGIQGTHVTGNTIHLGYAPSIATKADMSAALGDLQNQLMHEHSSGRLDNETYAAAQGELEIARNALTASTSENKSSFTLSLKRLRGLIDDVAEIAAKVAALIIAAKGMS